MAWKLFCIILFCFGMIVLNGIDEFDVMIRLCGFYYFRAFIFWYQYEWNNGIKWVSLKHSYENSFLLSNSGVTTCLKVLRDNLTFWNKY